jgi:16S rRNA (guanine(966)-N(2))-methyltransferase RsmD
MGIDDHGNSSSGFFGGIIASAIILSKKRKPYMSQTRRRKSRIKTYATPIIAGEFKGKRIEIPAVSTTRSSKAILRESLFNTLQFDLVDKPFVEVFAGSGSVALEAVSRGASRAWCMEKNREVYEILRANVERIAPGRVETVWGDSFTEFEGVYRALEATGERAYFYFDPPFSIREGMEEIYDRTLELLERIAPEQCELAIVEHMTTVDLPEKIGNLELLKKKRFGKSSLSYYRPVEPDEG